MAEAIAIVVCTVNAVTLVAIWRSDLRRKSQVLWTAVVLALPIVGAVFYAVMGDHFDRTTRS